MAELIDLPALASSFGRAVHQAGIPVTPERSVRFARVLALAHPSCRARLYWAARTVFVSSREQLATFDRVFATVFDGLVDPAAHRGDQNALSLQALELRPQQPRPRERPDDSPSDGIAP